jgi:hypothetical protein
LAGKETTKEYAITIAKAKKTFKKYKASKNSLSAELSSSGSTLTLGSFPHKPETVIIARSLGSKHEKAQVKVKIKKSSKLAGLNISPKAFLQKSNNATNIFAREGKSRFPIKVLRTISIPQMVGQENVVSRIQDEANKKLQERIQHEINWRLDKAARGK